jgi:hypothetical protein
MNASKKRKRIALIVTTAALALAAPVQAPSPPATLTLTVKLLLIRWIRPIGPIRRIGGARPAYSGTGRPSIRMIFRALVVGQIPSRNP